MKNKGILWKLILVTTALCILLSMVAFGCGPSIPKATKGGTLRIGASSDAQGLGYPATSLRGDDYTHMAPCVESLARYDAAGIPVPWLAESWKADATTNTITIILKKGIKFHDGTTFDATACKWNLDQFIAAKRPEISGVTSIDVVDESTIRLNLAKWNNGLISQLPFIGLMVSPTAFNANGGKDWAVTHPVGTGPFKFVSWERDVKIKYAKFDGYWQKGKPYLDAIEIIPIADNTVRLAAFQRGDVDVLEYAGAIPNDYATLKASGKYTLINTASPGTAPQGIVGDSGHADSPFADVRVRQAVSYAIDSQTIINTVLGGLAVPCTQYGLPGYWGYSTNVKGFPYNPTKAKQLLTEAGYPNGFKTTLLVRDANDLYTAYQGYLKAVGIDVTIDIGGSRLDTAILKTGWTGLVWIQLKGGADISPYFANTFSAKGVIWANSTIHPTDLEQLLPQITAATDDATKTKLTQQAQELIFEKYCILTPVFQPVGALAKYPKVQDDGLFGINVQQWTPEDAWIKTE